MMKAKELEEMVEIRVAQNGYEVFPGVNYSGSVRPTPFVFETMGALQSWLEENLEVFSA